MVAVSYIPRLLAGELRQQLMEFPVVTLLGPRQAGKTTLVRETLPRFDYVSLETPREREFARSDPEAFLAAHPAPAILDEVQRVPELLSYLQTQLDDMGGCGHYVLTGSHHLSLQEAVSQSLAGRTSVLTLLPLALPEMANVGLGFSTFAETCFSGFLPRVYGQKQRPTVAYSNYLRTYVERDVRQLIQLRDASLFQKFLKLLAGRVGQLSDHSRLGADVGVDGKTIRNWLSILEASFVVMRLNPYHENFGKRVIKSPKYYFTDTGLLCHLLDIETASQLERDPLVGHVFENLVVMECVKARLNQGASPNLFFFRDQHGREIDLLFKRGAELSGIEVKSAATWHRSFRKELDHFHEKVHPLASRAVVYSGEPMHFSDGTHALSYSAAHQIVE